MDDVQILADTTALWNDDNTILTASITLPDDSVFKGEFSNEKHMRENALGWCENVRSRIKYLEDKAVNDRLTEKEAKDSQKSREQYDDMAALANSMVLDMSVDDFLELRKGVLAGQVTEAKLEMLKAIAKHGELAAEQERLEQVFAGIKKEPED